MTNNEDTFLYTEIRVLYALLEYLYSSAGGDENEEDESAFHFLDRK